MFIKKKSGFFWNRKIVFSSVKVLALPWLHARLKISHFISRSVWIWSYLCLWFNHSSYYWSLDSFGLVSTAQRHSDIYTTNTSDSHVRSLVQINANIWAFESLTLFYLSANAQYLADRASVTYVIHINPDILSPILGKVLNAKKHCQTSRILIRKAIKIYFTWVSFKWKGGFY